MCELAAEAPVGLKPVTDVSVVGVFFCVPWGGRKKDLSCPSRRAPPPAPPAGEPLTKVRCLVQALTLVLDRQPSCDAVVQPIVDRLAALPPAGMPRGALPGGLFPSAESSKRQNTGICSSARNLGDNEAD